MNKQVKKQDYVPDIQTLAATFFSAQYTVQCVSFPKLDRTLELIIGQLVPSEALYSPRFNVLRILKCFSTH